MFKIISILTISAVIFFGCSTDSNVETVKEIAFYVSYLDQEGKDLLDPEHPVAITEQNTDLYYLIGNELVKQFEGHLDKPKKFWISTDEVLRDLNFMVVQSNIIEGQDMAISYLEFEDNTIDTVKTNYIQDGSNTHLTKVWYNGELRCDIQDPNSNSVIEDRTWCHITIEHSINIK